jgi:flavin reductase (DIM6/NTAB) family NADH-FMN oxidoreductase RutF
VSDASHAIALPTTVAPEVLKGAFRRHAAGVAVVTAAVDDEPIAITVSSLTSVSADPAVLLFSVSAGTGTGRAMARAEAVVVHLLDGGDHDLAVRCATPGRDRFDDTVAWEWLATGEPCFSSPRVRLRGTVVQRSSFGDSTVLMIAVVDVIERAVAAGEEASGELGPLAYHDRAWHVLGSRSRLG